MCSDLFKERAMSVTHTRVADRRESQATLRDAVGKAMQPNDLSDDDASDEREARQHKQS